MVDGGSMKTIDITPEEFATYRLNPGDVLFNRTNSIEHVGKTGLYDLTGEHTFASYLVRIVPDTKKIHSLFLTYMMNSREFQSEAKASAAKAINQANINATKMRNMPIPVPSLKDQQRFVKTVEIHEAKIIAAEAILSAAANQKAAILKKHL
jgi:restriction endonuclease S subunit